MAYNSFLYLIFLLVVGFLYFIVPKKGRWAVLLAAGAGYYFISSTWLTACLLATTLSVYGTGLLLENANSRFKAQKGSLSKEERKALKGKITRQKKCFAAAAVLLNFGLLWFFKYFNFFGETINGLLQGLHLSAGIPHLNLMMPLGISFYTLQAISYVVDVYRGKIKADRHLGRLALFLTFFPQMVEGPIGRYDQLAPQLYEGHSFDYKNLKFGVQRLFWGFFKKMVIADRAAILVNEVFDHAGGYSGGAVAIAILLYTLQIYAEFSGAMDMVNGTAQIFGVSMAENFRRPFFSASIQEFWQRWHITLGAWLRDYIFYPVSLSKWFVSLNKRVKKVWNGHFWKTLPVAIALFFVWFGNGIWHGASWKYICYGLYYYILMMTGTFAQPLTNRLIALLHIKKESFGYRVWQILRTALLVCFGMLLFRADSLPTAGKMFLSLFTGSGKTGVLALGLNQWDFLILAIGTAALFGASLAQEKGIEIRKSLAKRALPIRWSIYLLVLFAIIIFGIYGDGYTISNFIYGQF